MVSVFRKKPDGSVGRIPMKATIARDAGFSRTVAERAVFMARRRSAWCSESTDPQLERRELLSRGGLPTRSTLVESLPAPGFDFFHHDGIDGLVLHKHFVNRLNDRLANSQLQATRVSQALETFGTAFSQLPVNPPPGSSGPTLASLLDTLKQQVSYALSVREIVGRASPSQATAPSVSPLAHVALIPFALEQIDQAGAALAQLPPITSANGTLVQGNPLAILNVAANAIQNALAETSIHPNLFLSPGNFYVNPKASFDINFTGTPASTAAGFFIRGPHGVILPGATLHPHLGDP
jgi:hypothetical protein